MWRWIAVALVGLSLAYGARALAPAPPTSTAAPVDETTRLIELFEARLADRSDYPDVLALGELYLARATTTGSIPDHERASGLLERSVAMAPEDPTALEASARAALAIHDFTLAARRAEAAIHFDPGNVAAMATAVDAALAVGDVTAADAGITSLERSSPDDPAVMIRRSQLAWITGEPTVALEQAANAVGEARRLDLEPASLAMFEAHRARLLIDTGEYEQALTELGRQTEPVAAFQVGRAQAAIGRTDEAIVTLEAVVAARPDPAFMSELGLLYAAVGRPEDAAAIDAAIDAIAALDTDGVHDRAIANHLLERGLDHERASVLALADTRQDPGGHDVRAWALHQMGANQEALEEIEAAVAFGSSDPLIAFHAGVIRLANGDRMRGIDSLRTAVASSPGARFVAEAERLIEGASS